MFENDEDEIKEYSNELGFPGIVKRLLIKHTSTIQALTEWVNTMNEAYENHLRDMHNPKTRPSKGEVVDRYKDMIVDLYMNGNIRYGCRQLLSSLYDEAQGGKDGSLAERIPGDCD
jgi:hypothetical protein